MSYDERLAQRIREILVGRPDVEERQMFGHLAFTFEGNEAVRVEEGDLIVRVNQFKMKEILENPITLRFDKSHILVLRSGFRNDDDLKAWVECGISYAATLPPRTR